MNISMLLGFVKNGQFDSLMCYLQGLFMNIPVEVLEIGNQVSM